MEHQPGVKDMVGRFETSVQRLSEAIDIKLSQTKKNSRLDLEDIKESQTELLKRVKKLKDGTLLDRSMPVS